MRMNAVGLRKYAISSTFKVCKESEDLVLNYNWYVAAMFKGIALIRGNVTHLALQKKILPLCWALRDCYRSRP